MSEMSDSSLETIGGFAVLIVVYFGVIFTTVKIIKYAWIGTW